MSQISNFHSHCTFCDGRSHPEDFLKFAIANRLRAYGFSSHSPLPFETFWNMSKIDMPEYVSEINRLKMKYTDDIEVYLGLEIDYLDPTYHAAIPYFQSLPLDFRISSIHFLPWASPLIEKNMICIDGDYSDFETSVRRHFDGNVRRITEYFFESSMQMVERGGFDIIGHIDKIYMNGSKYPGFDRQADWYQKPFLKLLNLVAEKGYIVEINCKNMSQNGQTFPHKASFKELKKRDIPVMVNSDCHYPDRVDDGIREAITLIKEAGYTATRELVEGRWENVELMENGELLYG